MHSIFKTIFRNVEQNLLSCRLHHWENHKFTVRGNSLLSKRLESLSRDYFTLLSNYSGLLKDYAALSREYASLLFTVATSCELWIVKVAHEKSLFFFQKFEQEKFFLRVGIISVIQNSRPKST